MCAPAFELAAGLDPHRLDEWCFNCILRERMLLVLVERNGVLVPSVRQVRCTRKDDALRDHEIRWSRERKASAERQAGRVGATIVGLPPSGGPPSPRPRPIQVLLEDLALADPLRVGRALERALTGAELSKRS